MAEFDHKEANPKKFKQNAKHGKSFVFPLFHIPQTIPILLLNWEGRYSHKITDYKTGNNRKKKTASPQTF